MSVRNFGEYLRKIHSVGFARGETHDFLSREKSNKSIFVSEKNSVKSRTRSGPNVHLGYFYRTNGTRSNQRADKGENIYTLNSATVAAG